MAFSYDLASTDPTVLLISRLRLEIGDKVQGEGVFPDGSNFSDSELTLLLSEQGRDIERSAASACKILANTWSTLVDVQTGPRRECWSQVAKRYEQRLTNYETRLGLNSKAFSTGFQRGINVAGINLTTDYTP